MIGDTGTNYGRRTAGWQAALLLLMARGGWVNTIHGNLELLSDADARWFAKAQGIYDELQRTGTTQAFGGIAGDRYPYGFVSKIPEGSLYIVVNPAQAIQTSELPGAVGASRVLFHDAGFEPTLQQNAVRLGPGQIALVGFGRYADPDYDLGVGSDIRIPLHIEPIAATFRRGGQKLVYKTTVKAPERGDIRVIFRQVDENGAVKRSMTWDGMGKLFVISAAQAGKPIPVEINYDRVVWSGMSWAAGEIRHSDFTSGAPIQIRISSADPDLSLHLEGQVYAVEY